MQCNKIINRINNAEMTLRYFKTISQYREVIFAFSCHVSFRSLYKTVNLNSYKIVSVPNHPIACSTYIKKFRVIRILSTDDDLNENHCTSVIRTPSHLNLPPPSLALCFIGRCCAKLRALTCGGEREDLRGSETVCHLRTTNGCFTLLHYIF